MKRLILELEPKTAVGEESFFKISCEQSKTLDLSCF